MDAILNIIPLHLLFVAFVIAAGAGVIKGIVGFAMPMVLISGLSSFMPPDIALAGVILPTVFTNALQVFRNGWRAVVQTVQRFAVFLGVGAVMLLLSAQLVSVMPAKVFLLGIGGCVTAFAIYQLSGLAPAPGSRGQSRVLDATIGAFAGFVGGMSGIWGPPTVAYLTAIGTEKRMQMLAQGVIYGLGALLLMAAHLGSGILNRETMPLSAVLVVPAMLGMWLGTKISDRFDQATFRKVTLLVLILGGLNLVRRGFLA